PIAAPFVNVLAHVEEPVSVGLALADGFGAITPTTGLQRRQLVAPGIETLRKTAAGGIFPLGFGGQADRHIPLGGEPVAVRHGIIPSGAWKSKGSVHARRRSSCALFWRVRQAVPAKRFPYRSGRRPLLSSPESPVPSQ